MAKDMYFSNQLQLEELNCSSEQLHRYVNPSWESSMEQTAQFESALSSMVTSPAASPAACHAESFVIRELIGRLGSINNGAGEISPPAYSYNSSANTSCYNTPLNSPPKLNLGANGSHHGLAPFPSDPGFAERAARNSCFGGQSYGGMDLVYRSLAKMESSGKLSRVSSSHSVRGEIERAGDGREASSVSHQVPAMNELNARKRKAIPKSKPKDKDLKASQKDDSDVKRSKTSENGGNEKDGQRAKVDEKPKKDSSKPPEAPKDYIHVRARRGQATDSHSLAERVRREKISERMKLLQDLVPGCGKVTGKAVMLDEIINYVQSLQRQVEFLSMKLATVNPRLDFNIEALFSKEALQPNQFLSQTAYPFDPSAATYPFGHQNNHTMQLTTSDKLVDTTAQFAGAWDNDLQSIMQMSFEQNQELAFSSQSYQGSLPTSNMKVEL